MCILAAKFPSPCLVSVHQSHYLSCVLYCIILLYFSMLVLHIICVLQVVITLILNFFGVGLAITAVVMYSLDLAVGNFEYCGGHYYPSYGAALSPEQEQKNTEICLYYRHLNQVIYFAF